MSILTNTESNITNALGSDEQLANLDPNSLQNESEMINLYNIVKGGRNINRDPNVEIPPWEYEDDRV